MTRPGADGPPPDDWMESGLDLIGGELTEPVDRLVGLWEAAFAAGWAARSASDGDG